MACNNHHPGSSTTSSLLLHIDLSATPQDEDDSGGEATTRESKCGSNLSEIISQEKCHDDETTRTMHSAEQKGKGIAECTREQRWNTLVDVAANAHERKYESEEHAEDREEEEEEEEEKVVIKNKAKKKRRSRRAINTNDDDKVFEVPIVRSRRERAVAMPNKYKESFLGPLATTAAALEVATRPKLAANRMSR